jgi:endonuclease/exonuclease/phosphatase family metal-dependent hydrolase
MTLLYTLLVSAAFGGVFGLLIGSVRVRQNRRRLAELESDILSLDERLTREQKKRAGTATQEQRKDYLREAQELAAQAKTNGKPERLAGRASFSE